MDIRAILGGEGVERAAPRLLGCLVEAGPCLVRLVEVEAYGGEDDPGSHAWRGPTPRTRVMYGPPGFSFVYFTYGNHWMLNAVARPEGRAGAVLFRAAEPVAGIEAMRVRRPKARADRDLLSGPGKLAAALGLTGSLNALDLLDPGSPVRLLPGEPPRRILVGPRIGLSPGRGELTPWRFVDADRLAWASRPLRSLAALDPTPLDP